MQWSEWPEKALQGWSGAGSEGFCRLAQKGAGLTPFQVSGITWEYAQHQSGCQGHWGRDPDLLRPMAWSGWGQGGQWSAHGPKPGHEGSGCCPALTELVIHSFLQ